MKQTISKFIFFAILFNLAFTVRAYGIYELNPYQFLINKTVFNYSENYTIFAPSQTNSLYQSTYAGKIKKSAFRIRTNYDLSDANGWQATGITRLLSLGAIYPWAIDIDIYDTRSVRIGLIDGNIATLESAKFDIYSYDEAGQASKVAVALANVDFTHFFISTPDNNLLIAELNRDDKNWLVNVATPGIIDDRIIRIFSGFVVDYQDKFLSNIR